MTKQPLISVVMCTYNGAAFLQEQLDSIIEQTYKNVEIVICDDVSTDNTIEIVNAYCQKDSRIKFYINEKNLGYNKNFENACRLASGEYIAFADQDDIWEIDKLHYMMEHLWKNKSTLLVHCNSATFETGGRAHIGSVKARKIFEGNDVRPILMNNQVSGHNMIIKKSLLRLALPVPVTIYYDWWFAVVACCNGNINAAEKIFVLHRKHAKNATDVEHKPKYYEAVLAKLPFLLAAPNMSVRDKKFGEEMLNNFSILRNKKFSWKLFLFLITNAKIIFSFKRKVFPYFSYIKHAFKIASANCKAP